MIEAGETAGPTRGRVRESIEYFQWAFTPLRPMTERGIYELVSTNAFTTRGLYLLIRPFEVSMQHTLLLGL